MTQVNTYIEDCIAQKDPLIKILRLVCMQSVCNNGLKQKVLDYYKREIVQVETKTYWFMFAVASTEEKNIRKLNLFWTDDLNNELAFFVFCEDLWLWTHTNAEQPRKGESSEATDKLKEQLPHY